MAGIAGLMVKKPQLLGHTAQSTPEFDESFVTAALRFTVVPSSNCESEKGTKAIEWVLDATIVIGFDKADVLTLAVEVALMVIGMPGEIGGATYVAAAPFAVL
jgi:hypothetical protein